eukprot:Partr_v1_DN27917_c3_g1_i2_m11528 putative Stomatin
MSGYRVSPSDDSLARQGGPPAMPSKQAASQYNAVPAPGGHSSGPPKAITPATFVHQAIPSDYSQGVAAGLYGAILTTLGTIAGFIGTFFGCCSWNPYRTVDQGFAGVRTRFGRYVETVDPGLHYINLFTEKLSIIDVKMRIQDIPRQMVITKDNVSVNIDSVLYWHVLNPYTSIYEVSDVVMAITERTMTTMRQVIGAHDLQESITHREGIAAEIEGIIAEAAHSWGIRIEAILLKDLQFSAELQENLSAAAKSRRLAAARIIQAESEVEAAKLLREASDILDSPAAMQIRYLDTLRQMAKEANGKVIFMPPAFDKASSGAPNLAMMDAMRKV